MGTRSSARPTFGFLTHSITDEYGVHLWQGIRDAFRDAECNLICFLTRYSHHERGSKANLNFDLVSPENVDGLVISGGPVATSVGREGVKAFCEQFLPLPMVTLSEGTETIPRVVVDNYPGMYQIIEHLIVTHDCRRIVCIRGPEGNQDADERYQAYLNVLQAHHLPSDPELVVIGDFMPPSGRAAILHLLNERKVTFDAVVAANDNMALSAMETLIELGRRVPEEIAVAGFDDFAGSRCITPPLTTVRQSFYRMGQQAAQLLLAQLAGKPVEQLVRLPAEIIVRESCGCKSLAVEQAVGAARTLSAQSFADAITACRTDVVRNVQSALSDIADSAGQAEQLVESCLADIQGESPGVFVNTVSHALTQFIRTGGDVEEWHRVLSMLRRSLSPCFHQIEDAAYAEDLWQQARTLISEAATRMQIYRRWVTEQRERSLRYIEALLSTAYQVDELTNILAAGLSQLGIPRCYLAIYDDAEASLEWTHLLLAYQHNRRIELPEDRGHFRSFQLFPRELCPTDRIESLVVTPLYMKEEQLGFLVFEAEPGDGTFYEELRLQTGSTLKSALLMQQREQAYSEIRSLNEKLKQENLRMSAELEVSRKIQQMMLPSVHELQQIKGLDIVGFMQPADEVGGDYYDVLTANETVHIGIGDVTGHGLESGLLMLMTQTAARTLIEHGETDAVAFLATLNRTLFHNINRMRAGKMLTLAFINYCQGQIKLVGQHEDILVIRQGGWVECIDTINLGFPLGLEENIRKFISEATITLQPGEGVVLYTDGITEAENPEHKMYGLERLCKIIEQHWDKSAEVIKKAIVDDVTRHIGTQKIYDDLTLVVLKQ